MKKTHLTDSKEVNTTSEDIAATNIEKLKSVFPNFVKDGIIDFDALQSFLKVEGDLSEGEKYGLSWAGKMNAFKAARTPATGTLVPQPEESKHWDTTENIFIEGDNLEVLKLLQKHYREKIKMIYIDPPYNTGKDFVYKDNFTQGVVDYYEQTGQTKGGIKMTANTEKNGRYHSDWLTMMYPRLFLARNLLKEDGVIFVSIDDNEVANLHLIMDEIFGEENFVANLIWNKQHSQQQGVFKNYHEYILVYSRNEIKENISGGEGEIIAGALKKISKANPESEFKFPAGTRVESDKDFTLSGTYGGSEKVTVVSGEFVVKNGILLKDVVLSAGWTQKDQMKSWFLGEETIDTKGQKVLEFFFNSEGKLKCRKDRSRITPPTTLPLFGMVSEQTEFLKSIMGGYYFDNPKPVDMLKLFTSWFTANDDIVCDLFAGSGTTAHAVMDLNAEDNGNRKWICVQLPEVTDEDSEAYKAGYMNIADISRERIRRAGEKIKEDKVDINNPRVTPFDNGFKSYKLSLSNYRKWEVLTDQNSTEEVLKQSKLFIEKPLVDKYDEKSVICEILLKEGFDLNSIIEDKVTKDGFSFWTIRDGGKRVFVSFDKKITQEQLKWISRSENALFVCFDSALDDTTKVNIARQINLKVI